MVLCPVCHNRHPVNANYDNEEFICSNTGPTPKTFQNMVPETLLTKNNYVMNRASTKEDVSNRPVTVTRPKDAPADFRLGGFRHLEKNY
jgi:hypothetical protein